MIWILIHNSFDQDVLPSLLPYCHQVMCEKDPTSQKHTIHLLTHVIQQKAPPPEDGSQLTELQAYMMDFGVNKKYCYLVTFIHYFLFYWFFVGFTVIGDVSFSYSFHNRNDKIYRQRPEKLDTFNRLKG